MRTLGWSFLKAWFLEDCLLTSFQVKASHWHHNSHNHIKACSLQLCWSERGILHHPGFKEYYRNKSDWWCHWEWSVNSPQPVEFHKSWKFASVKQNIAYIYLYCNSPITNKCNYPLNLLHLFCRDLIFRLAQSLKCILSHTLNLRFTEISAPHSNFRHFFTPLILEKYLKLFVFKSILCSIIILIFVVSALASSVTRG